MSKTETAKGEGWSIQYSVQGSGPNLVLLHGGGPGATGANNYERNIAAFGARFTTYVIDLPGWGQSSKNLEVFGSQSPAVNCGRAVKAFMDAARLEKAHLVGNSLGGSAAFYVAMDHPERVDRLVTTGPSGAWIEGGGRTPGFTQLMNYYVGDGPSREKMKAFLLNMVYDTSTVTDALIDERFAASNDPDVTANPPIKLPKGGPPPKAAFLSNHPKLTAIFHPNLLIWGQQDRVALPAGAAAFGAIPNQDVVLFANCGHWAQWEHAQKFNELVLWFLTRR